MTILPPSSSAPPIDNSTPSDGKRFRQLFWAGLLIALFSGFALATQFTWALGASAWECTVMTARTGGRYSTPSITGTDLKEYRVPSHIARRVSPGDSVRKVPGSLFFLAGKTRLFCLNLWSFLFLVLGVALILFSRWQNTVFRETVNGFLSDESFLTLQITLVLSALLFGFDLA